MLNLAYLFAWLQRRNGYQNGPKCDLVLELGDDEVSTKVALWGRVTALLNDPVWHQWIKHPGDVFRRAGFDLALPEPQGDRFSERLIPLIPIDREVYGFLEGTVRKAIDHGPLEGGGEGIVISEVESGHALCSGEDLHAEPAGIATVLGACSHYLFKPTRGFVFPGAKVRRLASKEFFSKVESWSMLTFLLWSAFDKVEEGLLKNAKGVDDRWLEGSWSEKIDKLLPSVLDMSDGLLELMENTVRHAGNPEEDNGLGVLALRVHRQEDLAWDQSPLATNYKSYLLGQDRRRGASRTRWDLTSDDLVAEENSVLPGDPPSQTVTVPEAIAVYSGVPKEGRGLTAEEVRRCRGEWEHNRDEIAKRRGRRDRVGSYLEVRLIEFSGRDLVTTLSAEAQAIIEPQKTNGVRTFFDPDSGEREKWRQFSEVEENAVHHYGLQLFDSLLSGMDGCLVVSSRPPKDVPDATWPTSFTTSGDLETVSIGHGGVTEYAVLLPLRRQEDRTYAYMDVRVDSLEIDPSCGVETGCVGAVARFLNEIEQMGDPKLSSKERAVRKCAALLKEVRPTAEKALVFDVGRLIGYQLEIFVKALMLWLAKLPAHGQGKYYNIAVRGLGRHQFISTVRLLAVFYDRDGKNQLLAKAQIYLLGLEPRDEFWLAGDDLRAALTAQITLAASRGVGGKFNTELVELLERMLHRYPVATNTPQGTAPPIFRPFPFDMVLPFSPDSTETVHDELVRRILTDDIQDPTCPGCKLSESHTRIGSKVHQDCFYEAQLLFSNNYYVRRFARAIDAVLVKNGFEHESRTLVVGYEPYGEMLALSVCGSNQNWSHVIYESQSGGGSLSLTGDQRGFDRVVFLVPISTTMSTFRKVRAEVESAEALVVRNYSRIYITVVWVRPDPEDGLYPGPASSFFTAWPEAVPAGEKKVLATFGVEGGPGHTVHYLHPVPAAWYDPLTCDQCFPRDNMQAESPMASTGRSPVILDQLFGMNSRYPKGGGL
ncbi:MAG: hypothetical protein LBK95_19665 [Bifidobacteriaceae bacterium]|nr:hypothetical protein [Bifidobacteriaceae bacterium]